MTQKRRSKNYRRQTRVDKKKQAVTNRRPKRLHADWSRMTRVNVDPKVWAEFRLRCSKDGVTASDRIGQLVTTQVGYDRFWAP